MSGRKLPKGWIPRTPREQEQYFLNVSEKIGGTTATLSDEEQKSNLPFLGMLQAMQRQVNALQRDGRNVQQRNDQLASENRQLKTRMAELERKVNDLERSI